MVNEVQEKLVKSYTDGNVLIGKISFAHITELVHIQDETVLEQFIKNNHEPKKLFKFNSMFFLKHKNGIFSFFSQSQ